MLGDLDYARLKRSLAYFVDHHTPTQLITPETNPLKILERLESSQMSQARRGLTVAIADTVEGMQDFSDERVAEIDRDLEKRGAYTLSFLREHFTRRRDRI